MENVRFHITVKGIVVLNNQILLMKRARPSSDNFINEKSSSLK